MVGPPRAVAVVRTAVRGGMRASPQPVLVACSGGPDSVALAAALAFEARDAGVRVGGVIDLVGMEGFNRVWEGPENLPRIDELTAPERWVERVHGRPAIPA